jgi:hypothetical protein
MFGKLLASVAGFFAGGFLCAFCLAGCARPEYLSNDSHLTADAEKTQTSTAATLNKSGLHLSLKWKEMQKDDDSMGAFWLQIWRPNLADQSPVPVDTADEVQVHLLMPSMGHGSSPVHVQRIDVGTYLVEDVYFSMPGDWAIQVQLKNATGVSDEASIPIHY